MKKNYVLDTNILIHSSDAIRHFQDNDIVIPMIVLEELDGLKSEDGEKGFHARSIIRTLEGFRQEGDILNGIQLPEGGSLRIEWEVEDVPINTGFKDDRNDNKILQTVLQVKRKGGNKETILVTKDLMLRLKANILGIKAEDYTTDQAPKKQYTGRTVAFTNKIDELKEDGISVSDIFQMTDSGQHEPPVFEVNEFVMLKDEKSNKKNLAIFDGSKVRPLLYRGKHPFGVSPRNAGQFFIQEALMMPANRCPLVIIKGAAGTAKTFYSLAVGLEKVYNNSEYRRILIARPNAQFDMDIGFLPGNEQEKISPLMRPIYDNLEQLIDTNPQERYLDEQELNGKIEELFDRDIIRAEALNFIRGRSFENTYLIIDEAQNMTPKQVAGVITRAGNGTKVVLLGDPEQIDHPYLDERTNGLSYASEKMKGSPYCCQITMKNEECERSPLALDAIERL